MDKRGNVENFIIALKIGNTRLSDTMSFLPTLNILEYEKPSAGRNEAMKPKP